MSSSIRPSAVAGSWYPGEPGVLRSDILRYLDMASVPKIAQKPVAVISPHAGYMYSGPVAAHAYKVLMEREYHTVVVISPSHRAYFPFVSVWPDGGYETPLGVVDVDESMCECLIQGSSLIKEEKKTHLAEHALEIQLPFLQVALGDFKLCPLIMGEQGIDICRELALCLNKCIKDPDDVLVVASSDLSHFYRYETAVSMDTNLARRVESCDIKGLHKDLSDGLVEACGAGSILTAMLYAESISRCSVKVLKYANSGDVTGDRSSVVGYMAACIY